MKQSTGEVHSRVAKGGRVLTGGGEGRRKGRREGTDRAGSAGNTLESAFQQRELLLKGRTRGRDSRYIKYISRAAVSGSVLLNLKMLAVACRRAHQAGCLPVIFIFFFMQTSPSRPRELKHTCWSGHLGKLAGTCTSHRSFCL